MPSEKLATRKHHAWHRRAEESDAAWACFRAYLEQPRPRNHTRVIAPRKHPEALPEYIDHWCTTHEWLDRAISYDALIDSHEHRALEAHTQVEAMRNLGAIDEGFALVFRELRKHNAISLESEAPTIPVSQVVPLLRTVIELRRLAHGQSTSNISIAVKSVPTIPPDIAALSVEDLELLNVMQRKALKQ
jgi:hypothetical protein